MKISNRFFLNISLLQGLTLSVQEPSLYVSLTYKNGPRTETIKKKYDAHTPIGIQMRRKEKTKIFMMISN